MDVLLTCLGIGFFTICIVFIFFLSIRLCFLLQDDLDKLCDKVYYALRPKKRPTNVEKVKTNNRKDLFK